jgi:hypothetical protein
VAEDSNLDERRERRRLRDRLVEIRRRVNTTLSPDAGEERDDFDIHPFRPRHGAIWHAW